MAYSIRFYTLHYRLHDGRVVKGGVTGKSIKACNEWATQHPFTNAIFIKTEAGSLAGGKSLATIIREENLTYAPVQSTPPCR